MSATVTRPISSRRRRAEAAAPSVMLGDKDPMSINAKKLHLPLCEFGHPWAPEYACTRAAGHDEAISGMSLKARVHVSAPTGWAEAIW